MNLNSMCKEIASIDHVDNAMPDPEVSDAITVSILGGMAVLTLVASENIKSVESYSRIELSKTAQDNISDRSLIRYLSYNRRYKVCIDTVKEVFDTWKFLCDNMDLDADYEY